MAKRLDEMVARFERGQKDMAKSMWNIVFMNMLMDILPTKETFTHADLRAELERRRDATGEDFLRRGYEEALAVLAEHAPR